MAIEKPNLNDYFALSQNIIKTQNSMDLSYFTHFFKDYQDQQIQSACIDKHLGFQIDEIEKNLVKRAKEEHPDGTIESWSHNLHGVQSWVGLNPSQLQTPYFEFIEILNDLNLSAGKKVFDIGAGYGRLGILVGWYFKSLHFEGVEIVQERVDEGNRIYKNLDIHNAKLICSNVISELNQADVYFVYDFGNMQEMRKLISTFSNKADNGDKFIIIARGSAINKLLLDEPWLNNEQSNYQVSQKYTFN